jgi:hypothetical protein
MLARARVFFQSEGTAFWYAVAMKPEGGSFIGVLPKPKKSLKAYRYYIEATDKTTGGNRTPDFTTTVVDGPAGCQGRMMAGALGSAAVALEIPAGAPGIPAGFASSGVSSSVVAGSSATASGGGGGLPTIAIVGGGLAVGAVAAMVAAGGGSTYEGTFEGEMTITQTAGNTTCTYVRTYRGGSINIQLKQSGESVSGSGHAQATVMQTLRTASGQCQGTGPGAEGDGGIDGPITGTTSSFRFGFPPALNPIAGQGQCGGGSLFVGSLSGEVITGAITHTTFCEGSAPARGEVTIPVTLRR